MKPRLQSVISCGSSNTMFFRGQLVRKLGLFDERLGVGAEINGGEDTDYVLRAFFTAGKTLFVDQALIGHRDPGAQYRSRYFAGSFIVIGRYAQMNLAAMLAMVRKAAVGAVLVLKGELEFRAFYAALTQVVRSR